MVVLTYGTAAPHLRLLRSLAGEGVAADRVLIVHNPSSPGEEPASPEGCEVLVASHNLGYAAAMNLGMRRQLGRGSDFVLLLTHDARLRPGALRRLLAAASDHTRGALGPALVLTGTDRPFSFGGVTDRSGSVRHRRRPPAAERGVASCDWIDGGTMLLRADALHRVGGFDERLWSYFEDADLCLRIARAGFSVAVVLDALADQDSGAARRRGPWAYLMTRNGLAYARRFGGRRAAAAQLCLATARALLALARTAARASRARAGDPGETWALTAGTVRGALDFLRGRWGPPPADLPGAGDIRNLSPPAAG